MPRAAIVNKIFPYEKLTKKRWREWIARTLVSTSLRLSKWLRCLQCLTKTGMKIDKHIKLQKEPLAQLALRRIKDQNKSLRYS